MKKILVVEDDADIQKLIRNILEKERYLVTSAFSGTEAILLLNQNRYDLILLDLMLPGLSGEEIIEKVNEVPIIVISAKVNMEDKVNTLLKGANDYITKPFDNDELLARVKVQLRLNKEKQENSMRYKDLFLDKDSHILYIKENKIGLTNTDFLIMEQLMINPNKVVTKSSLINLIGNGELIDENSLKVHLSNIRKKIKKVSDNEYIESVWGIGYKLKE